MRLFAVSAGPGLHLPSAEVEAANVVQQAGWRQQAADQVRLALFKEEGGRLGCSELSTPNTATTASPMSAAGDCTMRQVTKLVIWRRDMTDSSHGSMMVAANPARGASPVPAVPTAPAGALAQAARRRSKPAGSEEGAWQEEGKHAGWVATCKLTNIWPVHLSVLLQLGAMQLRKTLTATALHARKFYEP
jgi:hypothetical protein